MQAFSTGSDNANNMACTKTECEPRIIYPTTTHWNRWYIVNCSSFAFPFRFIVAYVSIGILRHNHISGCRLEYRYIMSSLVIIQSSAFLQCLRMSSFLEKTNVAVTHVIRLERQIMEQFGVRTVRYSSRTWFLLFYGNSYFWGKNESL